MKNKFLYLVFFTVFLFLSCSDVSVHEKKLARIKQVGDVSPEHALIMLDSMKLDLRNSSEYIQHKADLLEIRLKDKAYITAVSDISIKELVSYFDEYGTTEDWIEVHYYAGSTYRDLHDTPRALEHFFKIVDACEGGMQCDSIVMRNTYSNLYWLYYHVQDYQNALVMAKKEYELDRALGDGSPISAAHVGTSYSCLDSCSAAEKYFIKSLELANKYSDNIPTELYPSLLYNFSRLKNISAAKQCFDKMKKSEAIPLTNFALAEYYNLVGLKDSVEYFCKKAINNFSDLTEEYDAAKLLFIINMDKSPQTAISYAKRFMEVCDSLDLGKRQQLAATVNNQHKYYRDMAFEQKIKEENTNYRFWMTTISLCFAILLLFCIILYLYKKYRMSRIIIAKNYELVRLRANKQKLEDKIQETETELIESQKSYKRTIDRLQQVNGKIQTLQNDVNEKSAELDGLKKELAERVEQASEFMYMLHQTELSASAQDIVNNIRQASAGKYRMSPTDWSMLFKAVDKLYPEFGEQLIKRLTKFNEHQKQVLYLIRIGLTNAQIENITDLPHTTTWRWRKKYGNKLRDILYS